MTPGGKTCIDLAVATATTLTPRIVNSLVRARSGSQSDGTRLEHLAEASDRCLELLEKIQLARLALQKGRRAEGEG